MADATTPFKSKKQGKKIGFSTPKIKVLWKSFLFYKKYLLKSLIYVTLNKLIQKITT